MDEKNEAFNRWTEIMVQEFAKLPNMVEKDGYNHWADNILPAQIEAKYYIAGRTGAEAMRAFWEDIANGKMAELLNEFNVPNPLGLIHSSSTLAKHLFVSDKMFNQKTE